MSYLKEVETNLIGRCTTACPTTVVQRYGGEFFSDESVQVLKQRVNGRATHLLVKLQSGEFGEADNTYFLEQEVLTFEIGVAIQNRREQEDAADEIYDIVEAVRKNARNVATAALTDGVVPVIRIPGFDLAHSEPGLSVYRITVIYTLKRDLEV